MTEYVVFCSAAGDASWEKVGLEKARSAKSAIKQWLEEVGGHPAQIYAAVPARSWRPVTVKVETKTALKFS